MNDPHAHYRSLPPEDCSLSTLRSKQAAPSTATTLHAPSDAQFARFAVDALLEEAHLTPKPALVDQRSSGAHRDLNLATMTRSAHALEPTFEALARASRHR